MSNSQPESKAGMALAYARQAAATAGSWIDLHNALFGLGGKLIELFPGESNRAAFARTEEYKEIMALIDAARAERGDPPAISDLVSRANGVINMRLPRSVHAALLAEAEAEGVSLNQLCAAKVAMQLRALVG